MANVWLIKDDEQPLILPAGSISAVICVEGEKHKEHQNAATLVLTNFRGGRAFFLGQDTASALEEIKAKDADPERWVKVKSYIEGGAVAFDKNTVVSYEGFINGAGKDEEDDDGAPWTAVYVNRPGCNNPESTLTCSADKETRDLLDKLLMDQESEPDAPASIKALRSVAPRKARK